MKKRLLRGWLCGALTGALMLAGGQRGSAQTGEVQKVVANPAEDAYDKMEVLAEVMLQVRNNFVEERSLDEIMSLALDGMLHSIDEYSGFLDADEFEDIQEDTEGRYGGIGIHIGMKGDVLTVIAPIEGTPAYRAGVQSGERIVAIDGVKTEGITLKQAVDKLRGERGSEVTLRLEPADGGEAHDVKIVRDFIEVPSVKGARMIRDGVGYLRITQFTRPTGDLLKADLEKLKGQGMKALVLDLRGNPGGLLTSAIDVSQLFLKRGAVVVTTKGREGVMPEHKSLAGGDTRYTDLPVAILVNKGSASASEIVAGALQDHKRAVLVGETTYGKGSVQSVVKLRSNPKQAIRLTTARYHTPSGRMIHGKGIEPDLPVEMTAGEWRDVQMARAVAEAPGEFSAEEKSRLADVVDWQLERAVDLLYAVCVFRSTGKP